MESPGSELPGPKSFPDLEYPLSLAFSLSIHPCPLVDDFPYPYLSDLPPYAIPVIRDCISAIHGCIPLSMTASLPSCRDWIKGAIQTIPVFNK